MSRKNSNAARSKAKSRSTTWQSAKRKRWEQRHPGAVGTIAVAQASGLLVEGRYSID